MSNDDDDEVIRQILEIKRQAIQEVSGESLTLLDVLKREARKMLQEELPGAEGAIEAYLVQPGIKN